MEDVSFLGKKNCAYCEKEMGNYDRTHSDSLHHLEREICYDCYYTLDFKPEMIYLRDNDLNRESAMKILGVALGSYRLDGVFEPKKYKCVQEVVDKYLLLYKDELLQKQRRRRK